MRWNVRRMSYTPKTDHYAPEHWWRKAVRKAGVTALSRDESDPIEAMRRIARAEAECARLKLKATFYENTNVANSRD